MNFVFMKFLAALSLGLVAIANVNALNLQQFHAVEAAGDANAGANANTGAPISNPDVTAQTTT